MVTVNSAPTMGGTVMNPLPRGVSERSFYAFLMNYPHNNDDSVGDLAFEVCRDPKAPTQNTRLIDYLNRRGVDADVLDEALRMWKESLRRER